ncbi:MAG: hypothetical protein D6731_01030 [Planctomycetota bacterium]|nr:MAG: hypothetical protein D6731_01030 [Planctomycetota bacterium]
MRRTHRFASAGTLAILVLCLGCDTGSRHDDVDGTAASGVTGPTGPGGGTAGSIRLSRLAPAQGSPQGGTSVTLEGTGFQGALIASVHFFDPSSEVPGSANEANGVRVLSDTELTCETPAHAAGVVDVRVVLQNGAFATLNNAFTFDPNAPGGGVPARVADFGDPTPWAVELLELANRARRDPAAEGRRLGVDLSPGAGYAPRPPLSHNGFLAAAAAKHTGDMIGQNFYGHWDLAGVGPTGRILDSTFDLHASYGTDRASNRTENIGVGSGNQFSSPQAVHDAFIVDAGTNPPKHRDSLLGKSAASRDAREIGMGVRFGETANPTPPTQTNVGVAGTPLAFSPNHWVTQEIARTKRDRALISGVVYNDDGDGICEAFPPYRGNSGGEGRGGVTVTLTHSSGFTLQTQTSSAGFYAFETFVDGDFTITIEGAQTTVRVAGDNVKVDHVNGQIRTY